MFPDDDFNEGELEDFRNEVENLTISSDDVGFCRVCNGSEPLYTACGSWGVPHRLYERALNFEAGFLE